MLDFVFEALLERWPELIVATAFAFVGTRWSRFRAHRRLRDRIAYELVETQKAMRRRADPLGGWTKDGTREEWMLEPYAMRVDFLVKLASEEGLPASAVDSVENYLDCLQAFFSVWAKSKYRSETFQTAYEQTRTSLEGAVQALGRRRRHRKALAKLKLFDRPESADNRSGSLALDPLNAGPANPKSFGNGDFSQARS